MGSWIEAIIAFFLAIATKKKTIIFGDRKFGLCEAKGRYYLMINGVKYDMERDRGIEYRVNGREWFLNNREYIEKVTITK